MKWLYQNKISLILTSFILFRITSDIIKGYPKHSWQISEWLINYQSGFVRRGLAGEIILKISKATSASPYFLILFSSLFIFLLFSFLLIYKTNRNHKSLIPLLLSSILLGMPVFSNFWVRKDILLLMLFTINIILLSKRGYIYIIINIIILSSAILIHESIGFWGLTTLFILSVYSTSNNSILSKYSINILKFFIPFTTFIACIINSRIDNISFILESWNDFYFPFKDLTKIPHAIEALNWNLSYGLKYSFSTFREFSDGLIYAPIIWSINIVAHILFILLYMYSNICLKLFRILLKILVIQSIFIIPLFILGLDYGRWMYFLGVSSYIIWLFVPHNIIENIFSALPFSINRMIDINIKTIESKFIFFKDKIPNKYLSVLLLFYSIPHCCWSINHYINCMPVIQPFVLLKNVLVKFKLFSLFL